MSGEHEFDAETTARFAAQRKMIESRAMRLCLAVANDDEPVFEYTLRECRCEPCQTALIGELAAMTVQVLAYMGGDWRGDLARGIAMRLDA